MFDNKIINADYPFIKLIKKDTNKKRDSYFFFWEKHNRNFYSEITKLEKGIIGCPNCR